MRPGWPQVAVQLEIYTLSVQCCSARPKPILPNPKTKQKGKVLMLDIYMQGEELVFEDRDEKETQVQTHPCQPQIWRALTWTVCCNDSTNP